MRDIIKMVRRYLLFSEQGKNNIPWINVVVSYLMPKTALKEEKAQLLNTVCKSFEISEIPPIESFKAHVSEEEGKGVRFIQGPLSLTFPDFSLQNTSLWNVQSSLHLPPEMFQQKLAELVFALAANEPVVLFGETGFKSELIRARLEISGMNNKVQTLHMTSNTEATDIVGQVQITSFAEVLQSLSSLGSFLLSELESATLSDNKGDILTYQQTRNFKNQREKLCALTQKFLNNFRESDEDKTQDGQSDQSSNSGETEASSESSEVVGADSDEDAFMQELSTLHQDYAVSFQSTNSVRSVQEGPSSAIVESDSDLTEMESIVQSVKEKVGEFIKKNPSGRIERSLKKFEHMWSFLQTCSPNTNRPLFMFKDGPFVKAITMKHVFVAKDYNLAQQAVTERLNSGLEVDPRFNVPEDVSLSDGGAKINLEVSKDGFAFIATVRLDSAFASLKISEASKSRLTEIRIPTYSSEDMMCIVDKELTLGLCNTDASYIQYIKDKIISLRKGVFGDDCPRPGEDFRSILRWIKFIMSHSAEISIEQRCILGAKFFYLDSYPIDIQTKALQECFGPSVEPLFQIPDPIDKASVLKYHMESEEKIRSVELVHWGLTLNVVEEQVKIDKENPITLSLTPCVLQNIARIFASVCTKAPLLLEGPPGIGKTAVVGQVARSVGKDLERINCSKDTTFEQLMGCVMPRYVNNRRRFEWSDGKLLKALLEKKWILLDEINLLPPEVLELLTPLLNGSAVSSGYSLAARNGGQSIKLDDITIFAAMNPASEGGGRAHLPRSFKNLFTVVKLDVQTSQDLFKIFKDLCQDISNEDLLSKHHIQQMCDVFEKVEQLAESNQLEGLEKSARFNLRDLTAVIAILSGNIRTQINHYKAMQACNDEEDEEDEDFDVEPVVQLVIKEALHLVFKHRFGTESAQAKIQEIIDSKIQSSHLRTRDEVQVDTSLPDLVRIGDVYLKREVSEDTDYVKTPSLVHTVKTVERLELLASASQSGRVVFLEGGTCSAKTALVKELAALIGKRLLVITLHQDSEVGDIIGQWLAVNPDSIKRQTIHKLVSLRNDILKTGIRVVGARVNVPFFDAMQSALDYDEAELASKEVVTLIRKGIESLSQVTRRRYTRFSKRLNEVEELLESIDSSNEEMLAFRFVEADLIKALAEGAYILFDNINEASPELVERILSLFEEEPFLNLYEYAEGTRKTIGDGIHPETRIFATANMNKINTHRLSAPLLDRMIRIWLPEIDHNLDQLSTEEIENHEVTKIVSENFKYHAGGDLAALLCVKFHAQVQSFVKDGSILLPKDARITYRMLQQACSVIKKWTKAGEQLFASVVWGLWRTYSALIENEEQLKKLKEPLQTICEEIASVRVDRFFVVKGDTHAQPAYVHESQKIQTVFAAFIKISSNSTFKVLCSTSGQLFRKLASMFLEDFLKMFYVDHADAINRLNNDFRSGNLSPSNFKRKAKDYGLICLHEYPPHLAPIQGNEAQWVSKALAKLKNMVMAFVSNSTFCDWQKRKAFVQDMVATMTPLKHIMDAYLKNGLRNPPSEVLKLHAAMIELLNIRHLELLFDPLKAASSHENGLRVDEMIKGSTNKALKFRLQKNLLEKISASDSKLIGSIVKLAKDLTMDKEERNKLGMQYLFTSLIWKTNLKIDTRLLICAQEEILADEIISIQRALCKYNLQKKFDEILRPIKNVKSDTTGMLGKVTGAFAAGVRNTVSRIPNPLNFVRGKPSSSSMPSAETELDAFVLHSRVEEMLESPDAGYLFSKDLGQAIDFHASILDYLVSRKKTETFPKNLDAFFQTAFGSDISSSSMDAAHSEFAVSWLALFVKSMPQIPVKLLSSKKHDPRSLKINNEDELTAVLLVDDLENCKKLDHLVSLVVFEHGLEQEGLYLTVHEYSWTENPLDDENWVSRWVSIHQDRYEIIRTNQILKPCDFTAATQFSGLGEGLIACLSVVQSWEKKGKGSSDGEAEALIKDLNPLRKSLNVKIKRDSSTSKGLFESVLKLDGFLRSCKRSSGTSERKLRKFKDFCENSLSSSIGTNLKFEILEKMKCLEGKVLSDEWQSLSIARSFICMLDKLKDLPMNEMRTILEGLKQKTNQKFSDAFIFLELLFPVVKLRDFFIQFMMHPDNLADSKVWMKCNSIGHFMSHLISFYVELIESQIGNEMIRIRRDESLEKFNEWQVAFEELMGTLDLNRDTLEANDLDRIFLVAKGLYLSITTENLNDADASSETTDSLSSHPSLAQVMVYNESQKLQKDMEDLKMQYVDLWSKVKNSINNSSSSFLKEIRSTVSELAMMIQSKEISSIAAAKYTNKFHNLKQAFASLSDSKTQAEDSEVPTEYVDLVNKRQQYLESSNFEIVDQGGSGLNVESNEVIHMIQGLHKDLHNDHNGDQNLKRSLEILKSAIKCSWTQHVWTKAMELCKNYSRADGLSGKQQVLEQLSSVPLLSSSMSTNLAFHAKSIKDCDEHFHTTVCGLVQIKRDFLTKDYMASMEYWNSEELQNSVRVIEALSNGSGVTIKDISSHFQSVSKCHEKLQGMLSDQFHSQEHPSTLMLPFLSKDDVISVFADDLFTPVAATNEEEVSMDVGSSDLGKKTTGILGTYSYESEDEGTVHIFNLGAISNIVASVTSIVSDEDNGDYDEIRAEACVALCTLIFPWLIAQQDLDHIASHLCLSGSCLEKRSMDEGLTKLAYLRQELKRAEDYLQELERGELNLPGTSQGMLAKTKHSEHAGKLKREIEAVEKDNKTRELKLQERKEQVLIDVSSAFNDLMNESLALFGPMIDLTSSFFFDQLSTDGSMHPDSIGAVFDEALEYTNNKIQSQSDMASRSSKSMKQLTENVQKFAKQELSLLSSQDPLHQALTMLCAISQIGHQQMAMLFKKHSCKVQEMVNDLTHLRDRIEDQCQKLQERCLKEYVEQEGIQEQAQELLRTIDSIDMLDVDYDDLGSGHETLHYAKLFLLDFTGVCCAHAHAMYPLSWYLDNLFPVLKAAVEAGQIPALAPSNEKESAELIQKMTVVCKSLCSALTTLPCINIITNPFELCWRVETYLHKNREMYSIACFLSQHLVSGMNGMQQKNEGHGTSRSILYTNEAKKLIQAMSKVVELDLNRIPMNDLVDELIELRQDFDSLTTVARNAAKHPTPYIYGSLKPLLDAFRHRMISLVLPVQQRESSAGLEALVNDQEDRIANDELLIVDFGDLNGLHERLNQCNVTLKQLGYNEEAVSWLHMFASFLHQFHAHFGRNLVNALKALESFPETTIEFKEFEICLDTAKAVMTLPAGTISGVDPSCIELLEKLDKRSSFIPSLHRNIFCNIDVKFAEVQQKIELFVQDLSKWIGMSSKADEEYSAATKALATAREQEQKSWWQWFKESVTRGLHRKDSLAPELHRIASDICHSYALLWRCLDTEFRARGFPFRYNTDEFAQSLSHSLKKVVETQKALNQKGAISEDLDLSKHGIQERLISVTLIPHQLASEIFVYTPVRYIQICCEGGSGDPVTLSSSECYPGVPMMPIQFCIEDPSSFKIAITSVDQHQNILQVKEFALHEVSEILVHDIHNASQTGTHRITMGVNRSYLYVAPGASQLEITGLQFHENLFEGLCQEYHEKANDLQKLIDEVTENENKVSRMDSHMRSIAAEIMTIQEADHSKALTEMQTFLLQDVSVLIQDKQPTRLAEDISDPEAVASHVIPLLKQIKELFIKSKKLNFNEDRLSVIQLPSNHQNQLLNMDLKTQWTTDMKDAFTMIKTVCHGTMDTLAKLEQSWLEFWRTCLLRQTAVTTNDKTSALLRTQQQEWLDCLKESHLPPHVRTNWQEETVVSFIDVVKLRNGRIQWSGPFENSEKMMKNVKDLHQQSNEDGVLFGARLQEQNQLMICDQEDGGCGLSSASPLINFGVSLHPEDLHATGERQVQFVEVLNRTQRIMTIGLEPEMNNTSSEKFALMASKRVRLYGNTSYKFQFIVNRNVAGKVQETWILRSDDVHLNEVFTMCVDVQRLGVQLNTEVIDFGSVITGSSQERVIQLRSVTDLPLLVKSQLQISQKPQRSDLQLSQDTFKLLPRSSQEVKVSLKASPKSENVSTDMMVAIVSAKNSKVIKIVGEVKQPASSFKSPDGRLIRHRLELPPTIIGNRSVSEATIRNTGQVPVNFSFEHSSDDLKITPMNGSVPVKNVMSVCFSARMVECKSPSWRVTMKAEGIDDHTFQVSGKWIDPVPTLSQSHMKFEVTTEAINKAKQDGGNFVTLTAKNKLVNKTEVEVNVYPPRSPDLEFCQECYVVAPEREVEFTVKWKTIRLIEEQQNVVLLTENGKEVSLALSQSSTEEEFFRLKPLSLLLPQSLPPMETREVELTFKCKERFFIATHQPESEFIESVETKEASRCAYSIPDKSSRKSEPITGTTEIKPNRGHAEAKFTVNVKANNGSGWVVQDIISATDSNLLIQKDLFKSQEMEHKITLIAHVSQESNVFAKMLREVSKQTRTSPSGTFCVPDIRALTKIRANESVQAFLLMVLFQIEMFKKDWELDGELLDQIVASESDECVEMCAQHTCNTSAPSSSSDDTYKQALEYFSNVRDLYDKDGDEALKDICIPAFILRTKKEREIKLAFAMYLLNNPELSESEQWQACIGCLVLTMSSVLQAVEFRRVTKELVSNNIEEENLYQCPSFAEDLELVKTAILHDDEEYLVAFDFLETIIGDPSKLPDECLAAFGNSSLKFEKEWFAQLLTDPASLDPTKISLSFLNKENKETVERLCSEDLTAVFIEFCKIGASDRHRPEHALIEHLLGCVITTRQQRRRLVGREDRAREWLMPILDVYDFVSLIQPLCTLLAPAQVNKDSKKRSLRILVLKLISWAVNQSGDESSTAIWREIEKSVEELIRIQSFHTSRSSTQRQNLNLDKISNEDKKKNIEKCVKEWIALDPIQDVSLLVRPLIYAYEELTRPDEMTASSSTAPQRERIKVELIVDALKALGPEELSQQTKLLELLGRVLVFVSYWDNSIEELACSWLEFAQERNRDKLHPLLESIADTCLEPGPLYGIIAALPQDNEHVDEPQYEIAKEICPEESFVALQNCVTSLIRKDIVIDNKTKAAAEEICSPEGKEAFSAVDQFVKARNAFTNLESDEVSPMTELMVLKDLMDIVCKIAGWNESKKKSISALNILCSYRAFNLMKNSSHEAYCMAKMSLMMSVMYFYRGKHWEQKEATKKNGLYCLQWEKADISSIAAESSTANEEPPESELEAEDQGSVSDAVDDSASPDWKWFLEEVDILEDQLESPGHENEESENISSSSEDNEYEGTGIFDETQTSEFSNEISNVQAQLMDLESRIDVHGILKRLKSGDDLPLLEFADIVKLAADLTSLSDTWSVVFRFVLDHCNSAKSDEEKTLEFIVVQSGMRMLCLLEFLCEYLRHCSHFEIPTEIQEAHVLVVRSLKLIPSSNLPKSYQTLLAKFDNREAESLATLKDFPMPSKVLKQEGSMLTGPSLASEKLNFSPLEDASLEEISNPYHLTPSHFEQKINAASASLVTEDEERNSMSILNQKIKIDVSSKRNQPTSSSLSDEGDQGSTSSSTVEQILDSNEGFKLPSTLTGRVIESGSQRVYQGPIDNAFVDDFEILTSGPNEDFSHKIEADIELSMEDKRQLLNATHLAKVYKDTMITRAEVEREEVPDATIAKAVKHDRWTYQLLVESKPLMKFLVHVLQDFHVWFKELYRQTTQLHRFEWCIMVDNSGSMLAKENQTMEALVLVMEMLKRLEHPFAVARFGNRKSQRILKPFNEHLTHEVGQRILESFSYDEGTYPASGFANISEKLWPKRLLPEEHNVHRIAFMIVDGLTQEREPTDYTNICEEKGIDLVVLNLKDEAQNELMSQIEALWTNAATTYQVLDVTKIDALSELVAALMIDEIRHILEIIKSKPSDVVEPSSRALSSVVGLDEVQVIPVDPSMKFGQDKMPWLVKKYGNRALFATSYLPDLIPFQDEMEQLGVSLPQTDIFGTEALFESFEKGQSQLQSDPNKTEVLKTANGVWHEAVGSLSGDILKTTEALESFLPINVYTRKRPDVKGPSLHLQGFIKHLATQGNEKKIFANKKGGGRSAYGVFILLDTSASMKYGRREQYALETLMLMIESLQQMNIQNFGVACFGQEIYPIKMPESVWDDTAVAALLSKISQGYEMASMDADALLFASEVLENSHSRGPKKIFILTDGYGSSGVRLAAALSKLSDMGIDVVAMGIGPEAFFVKDCYNKWITATLPHLVPDALTELSQKAQNTAAGLAGTSGNQKESIDWLKTCLVSGTGAESVEEVLRNKEQFFPELMKEWSNEREVMLQAGNRPTSFTVDICFALDCTGSMGPWIEATKQQLKFIATKIEGKLKEHHPKIELELSFGMVAYRDYGDNEQHSVCPLSSNLASLLQFLDSQTANGGGDAPEDVLGALHVAATTINWNGKIRFCVLIADYPGHGSDLNDYGSGGDRYFNEDPNGFTSQGVMKELKDKDIHLMFCRITRETDKMINCFQGHYNDNMKHELISKDLFGAEQSPCTGGFHFVFCLDESGSMAGRPWHDLEQAFARFLHLRQNSQYTNDIISVVQFNSVARIVHQGVRLSTSVGLARQKTGGTQFRPALDYAHSILNTHAWNQFPVLIFMSDGQAGDNHSDILNRIEHLKNTFRLQVHTVGFGSGAGHGLLSAMADRGGGKHHRAIDGIQLSAVFANIATGTTAMESMVCKFGGVISDMVSSKIIIDHL